MVADMSVGVGGMSELEDQLKNLNDNKQITNNSLNELIRLKRIEVTNKKPDVMFLYELLDFLKDLPVWDPEQVRVFDTDDVKEPKVCFVTPKWNGRVEVYRDSENICDVKMMEGQTVFLNVNYYIHRLSEALKKMEEEV